MNFQQQLTDRGLSIFKIEGGWTTALLDIFDSCQGRTDIGISKVLIKKLGLKTYTSNIIFIRQLLRAILKNKFKNKINREKSCDKILHIYSELSYNIAKKNKS